MTLDLLARLADKTTETVAEQVRRSHAALPNEKCMAWLHQRRFPLKEGGCDIHRDDS